ncbi:MAG: hypothetical protein EOP84_07165 [Verrucomicrobiaceae bacterium]|nr:MAG: hypothetical protein EOP84_07165 [Verrucomicrobiaceae bacterium]
MVKFVQTADIGAMLPDATMFALASYDEPWTTNSTKLVLDWCIERFGDHPFNVAYMDDTRYADIEQRWSHRYENFIFREPRDALEFKLRWC